MPAAIQVTTTIPIREEEARTLLLLSSLTAYAPTQRTKLLAAVILPRLRLLGRFLSRTVTIQGAGFPGRYVPTLSATRSGTSMLAKVDYSLFKILALELLLVLEMVVEVLR